MFDVEDLIPQILCPIPSVYDLLVPGLKENLHF